MQYCQHGNIATIDAIVLGAAAGIAEHTNGKCDVAKAPKCQQNPLAFWIFSIEWRQRWQGIILILRRRLLHRLLHGLLHRILDGLRHRLHLAADSSDTSKYSTANGTSLLRLPLPSHLSH